MPRKENQISKQTSTVEWRVIEDDGEWQRLWTSGWVSTVPNRRSTKRLTWEVAVIVLLLVSSVGWRWYTTHRTLRGTVAAVRATAQKEVASAIAANDALSISLTGKPAIRATQPQFGRDNRDLRAAVQTQKSGAGLEITVDMVDAEGDQAVVKVIISTKHGQPAYRQTRFYRRSAGGWLPTTPDAALWGAEQQVQTPFFLWRYRERDAQVVAAVAPLVDDLYTALRRNFGLSLTPNSAKLVIEVSVTQPPGNVLAWFRTPAELHASSPAVYWAPVELSDAALLQQSSALPLLDRLLAEAKAHHAIKAAWHPLLDGLRLWQLWDLKLPLAPWGQDLVKWLYLDLPTTQSGRPVVLPDHYVELCAAHQLWLTSPAQVNIPLSCGKQSWEAWYLAQWTPYHPPTRLSQLAVPVAADHYAEMLRPGSALNDRGYAVALATLLDYAVAAYGRERLPLLLTGLGHYESWDTLLPAVYGVAPAQFEAGWQAYLAAHYGQKSGLMGHYAQ